MCMYISFVSEVNKSIKAGSLKFPFICHNTSSAKMGSNASIINLSTFFNSSNKKKINNKNHFFKGGKKIKQDDQNESIGSATRT